jgi:hypothetical protein
MATVKTPFARKNNTDAPGVKDRGVVAECGEGLLRLRLATAASAVGEYHQALNSTFNGTLIDEMSFQTLAPETSLSMELTAKSSAKRTFFGMAVTLPVDATDSNWQQRRRSFGGCDVGATEAG